jgi:hypothetical protein
MNRRQALKKSGLLVGIGLSTGAVASMMQSCSGQDRVDWEPVFFSQEEASTVAAMVDVLLPQTETPGGLELKIDLFVDLMFKESLSPEDQKHVRDGLASFLSQQKSVYGKPFPELDIEDKEKVMQELGDQSNTFNVAVWGSPIGEQAPLDFYRRLRQFALMGYFTSEEIGKNVMNYDPIPGEYEACIPLEPGQKIWTL